MLSYKKRFEGMVTENQAVTVFRNQIQQFFNEAVSATKVSKIDALLTTDDPVEMKTIICYGSASKIDTLTDTLCSLSSPGQWLSQSNQKKLTELIVCAFTCSFNRSSHGRNTTFALGRLDKF